MAHTGYQYFKVSDAVEAVLLFIPTKHEDTGNDMAQAYIFVSCWGPGKVLHNSWKTRRHNKCSGKKRKTMEFFWIIARKE